MAAAPFASQSGYASSSPFGVFSQHPSIRIQPNAEQQQHLELFHQEAYIYNISQLQIAARAGTPDEILILVQRGENLFAVPAMQSKASAFTSFARAVRGPLHEAAISGSIENVIALIQLGTPPDIIDSLGRTSMHYAAYLGRIDIIQVLAQAGANIDALDIDGNTPLSMATTRVNVPNDQHDFRSDLPTASNPIPDEEGYRDVMPRSIPDYLKAKNGVSPAETIIFLLRLGSRAIDHPNEQKVTPLNSAVKYLQLEIVEALILSGSRAQDIPDTSGDAPLHLSYPIIRFVLQSREQRLLRTIFTQEETTYRRYKIVEFLIRHGVQNLDPVNDRGETPFYLSVWLGRPSEAQLFLKYGSRALNLARYGLDRNTGTYTGEHNGVTPLLRSVVNGNVKMVKFLLEAGSLAMVNIDRVIETPIDSAIDQIFHSERGLEDEDEDDEGRAADLRRLKKYQEILAILKSSGNRPVFEPADPQSYFSLRGLADVNVTREELVTRAQQLWEEPVDEDRVWAIRNEIFFQPLLTRVLDAIIE